jgi:hypothetical protein
MPIIVDLPISPTPVKVEMNPNPYFREVIAGGLDGVCDFGEMLKHPLEHCVYPIGLFLRDVAILSSGMPNSDEDWIPLETIRESKMYIDAQKRMDIRVDGLIECGINFGLATGPERVRMISRLGVSILLPGATLKLAARLKGSVEVYHQFGVWTRPHRFEPITTADLAQGPVLFRIFNARNIPANGEFMYVITAKGELRIAPFILEEPTILPSGRENIWLRHPELAGLEPVVSAGHVTTKNGRIVSIDNLSGHYHPTGDHLPSLTERVFEKNKFEGVKGTYQKKEFLYPEINAQIIPESPFLPPYIERSLQIGFLMTRLIDETLPFEEYPLLDPFIRSQGLYSFVETSSVVITKAGVFQRDNKNQYEIIGAKKLNQSSDFSTRDESLSTFLRTDLFNKREENLYESISQKIDLGPMKPVDCKIVDGPASTFFGRSRIEVPSLVDSLYPVPTSRAEPLSSRVELRWNESSRSTVPINLFWKMTPMPKDATKERGWGTTPMPKSLEKGWGTTPFVRRRF